MHATNLSHKALKSHISFFAFMLITSTILYSGIGNAACVTPSLRVPMAANISMPANVNSGAVLVNWSVLNVSITCKSLDPGEAYTLSTYWLSKYYKATETIPFPDGSNNALIWSAYNISTVAGYAAVIQGTDGKWRETLGNPATHGSVIAANDGTLIFNFKIAMALVKTGTALTGPINPAYVNTGYSIKQVSTGANAGTSNYYASSTALSTKTCAVTTTSININLPEIASRDIPSINSTAGRTPFTIGLTCPQPMNVYMTLTDASNTGNQSNVLGVFPTSSARGVALQIMNGANVIKFGPDSFSGNNINQFLVGLNMIGNITIPMTVSYIRTSMTIAPGELKSAATFTMSYQ